MRTLRLAIIAAAFCLSLGATAWALDTNPECVAGARDDYVLCRTTCREQFQVDKDMCRNVDHDCADAARAGRQACVAVPLGALDTCKDACGATLASSKQTCRDENPEGSVERDTCIDAAQLIAFGCRDTCREGVSGELKLCRRTFRATLRACPPAAE